MGGIISKPKAPSRDTTLEKERKRKEAEAKKARKAEEDKLKEEENAKSKGLRGVRSLLQGSPLGYTPGGTINFLG